MAHLSKGPSDLKQNGTQEKTPFSCPVFHCLSCGVVRFVPTVSFWNHQIEASHWLKEEFWPIRKWFLELTLGTKQTTPRARAQKTIPENGAFSWVPFCFRSHVRFERCAPAQIKLNEKPQHQGGNDRCCLKVVPTSSCHINFASFTAIDAATKKRSKSTFSLSSLWADQFTRTFPLQG